jgi:hypothetical protein
VGTEITGFGVAWGVEMLQRLAQSSSISGKKA